MIVRPNSAFQMGLDSPIMASALTFPHHHIPTAKQLSRAVAVLLTLHCAHLLVEIKQVVSHVFQSTLCLFGRKRLPIMVALWNSPIFITIAPIGKVPTSLTN